MPRATGWCGICGNKVPEDNSNSFIAAKVVASWRGDASIPLRMSLIGRLSPE